MEFSRLDLLLAFISDKYTPAGGDDGELITAEELRKGMVGMQEFLNERGLKVIANTGDFASTKGIDAQLVLVIDKGIYQYSDSGSANGIDIFAANTTGVFTLIARFPPKPISGTFNVGAPKAQALVAPISSGAILFTAAADNTIQIGTSTDGTDMEEALEIKAGVPLRWIRGFYFSADTTLYFSGASSQVNYTLLID